MLGSAATSASSFSRDSASPSAAGIGTIWVGEVLIDGHFRRFDNPAMASPRSSLAVPSLRWDIFCRVVDNLGDAGVCWRLAADLAGRGQRVRLVIDQAMPLTLIAPLGAPGVEVQAWPADWHDGLQGPGDVVVEAFGC